MFYTSKSYISIHVHVHTSVNFMCVLLIYFFYVHKVLILLIKNAENLTDVIFDDLIGYNM